MYIALFDINLNHICLIRNASCDIKIRTFDFNEYTMQGEYDGEISNAILFTFNEDNGKQLHSGFVAKVIDKPNSFTKQVIGRDFRELFDTEILFSSVTSILGALFEYVTNQVTLSSDQNTQKIGVSLSNIIYKNIFDYSKPHFADGAYITQVEDVYTISGNLEYTIFYSSTPISVTPGQVYTLSISNDLGYGRIGLGSVQGSNNISGNAFVSGTIYTFTAPSSIVYINFDSYDSSSQPEFTIKFQLEKGSVATAYEKPFLFSNAFGQLEGTQVVNAYSYLLTYFKFYGYTMRSYFDWSVKKIVFEIDDTKSNYKIKLNDFKHELSKNEPNFNKAIATMKDNTATKKYYYLNTENDIIESDDIGNFANRYYPVKSKFYMEEYLANAQYKAILELCNQRFIDSIYLDLSSPLNPIDLSNAKLNDTVDIYLKSEFYKQLPISEIQLKIDSKGSKTKIKLGFKKDRFTQIVKEK